MRKFQRLLSSVSKAERESWDVKLVLILVLVTIPASLQAGLDYSCSSQFMGFSTPLNQASRPPDHSISRHAFIVDPYVLTPVFTENPSFAPSLTKPLSSIQTANTTLSTNRSFRSIRPVRWLDRRWKPLCIWSMYFRREILPERLAGSRRVG